MSIDDDYGSSMDNNKNSNEIMETFWDTNLIDRLICTLCCYLLFPPMQLVCCGQRICEVCAKFKLKEFSQCPYCSEPGVPEARSDRGFKRELDQLQVNCPRCDDKGFGFFKDLPIHLNKHQNISCENCNETFILPQQLRKHQLETCENRSVSCPLDFLGCSQKVPHKKLNEHYLNEQHQNCLLVFVKEILPQFSGGQTNSALQKSLNQFNQQALTECFERINTLIQEIDRLSNDCNHLKSEKQIQEAKINEIRTQSTKIKESSDKSNKLTESILEMLDSMSKLLSEIKSKSITGHKLLSSDNTFIWKVNIVTLITEGHAMQSDPINTSQSGYKMAIGCNIIVDEAQQKRYISLSYLILPGDFDAILPWPVPFPITLALVDLTATKKDISYSIPRDFRTEIFNRPLNNANVHKIAQFYPLDKLLENNNSYARDGFIYIRLYIDFIAPTVHPVSNREQSKVTYDPIQTNILPNLLMK